MGNADPRSVDPGVRPEPLAEILDSVELGLLVVDASTGSVLEANATAAALIGLAADELREAGFFELAGTDAELVSSLRGIGTAQLERRHVRGDGSSVWLGLACALAADENGRSRLRVVVSDVTSRRTLETALWQSEERLRLAFEVGRMGCWERDIATDEVVWMGQRPEELFELKSDDIPGGYHDLLTMVHPDDRQSLADAAAARLRGETVEVDFRVVPPGGGLHWVSSRGTVLRDELGAPKTMIGVWTDVTERRLADEELRRTHELLASVVDASPVAIIAADPQGRIVMWNPAAERMFGWRADEVLGRRVPIIPPEHEAAAADLRERVLSGDSHLEIEAERQHRNGDRLTVSLSLAPWRDADGAVVGVLAALVDVADRVNARRELERSFDLLRQADEDRRRLLSQLVRAQEEERKRVAADIHDDTVQAMTAVGLRLALLRKEAEHGPPGVRLETIDGLERSVGDAISRLRRLLVELRPPELDRGGLGSVLRMQLEQARSEHDLDYSLENHLLREPSGEIRAIAYRIAQEALTNARKHSGASCVDVRLENVGDGVFVRVHDDGSGFDVDEVLQSRRPGHFGLIAMRERAELAGGWLRIDSDDTGTTVQYWLPGSVTGPAFSTHAPHSVAISTNGAG